MLEALYKEGIKVKNSIHFVATDTYIDKNGESKSNGLYKFLNEDDYKLWRNKLSVLLETNNEFLMLKPQVEFYFAEIENKLTIDLFQKMLLLIKSNIKSTEGRGEFFISVIVGNFVGILFSVLLFGFSKPTTDSYIGIIATFIGVIVTVAIGFQIYNAIQLKKDITEKHEQILIENKYSILSIKEDFNNFKKQIDKSIDKSDLRFGDFDIEMKSLKSDTRQRVIDSLCNTTEILIVYYLQTGDKRLLIETIFKLIDSLNEYGEIDSETNYDFHNDLLFDSYMKMASQNFTIEDSDKKYYHQRIDGMKKGNSYNINSKMIDLLSHVFHVFSNIETNSEEKKQRISEYKVHVESLN